VHHIASQAGFSNMSASVRPSMLYKCVLAGIEHRLVCFLVVTQGSQGDLCGLLTALYAGIPKDGNSNVVADLIRGICKDLLHVEIILASNISIFQGRWGCKDGSPGRR
jgi:hypothetical protein